MNGDVSGPVARDSPVPGSGGAMQQVILTNGRDRGVEVVDLLRRGNVYLPFLM